MRIPSLPKKKLFVLFFAFSLVFISAGSWIQAEDGCAPACEARKLEKAKTKGLQIAWPPSPLPPNKSLDACSTLPELIAYFYGWAVGLGGIAVFISLVIAGLEYVTSVGSPEKMKGAFKRIQSSVIGLTLLLGSYAILQLINPQITNLAANSFKPIGETSAFTFCKKRVDCCNMPNPDCKPANCPDTNKDCCMDDLIPNPNCNPKDWACCALDDAECMASKAGERTQPRTLIVGKVDTDGACKKDSDCNSNNCKDCKCVENRPVCSMVFNRPELGCDFVRFYKEVGKDPDRTHIDIYGPTVSSKSPNLINQTEYYKFTGTSYLGESTKIGTEEPYPRAYEAFRFPRKIDPATGNETIDPNGEPESCGASACGCRMLTCLVEDASNMCKEAEGKDLETGEIVASAYADNVSSEKTILQVRIEDPEQFGAFKKTYNWLAGGVNMVKQIVGSH